MPEKDRKRQLLAIAFSQGGYFTAKQARSAGYSYRLQHYHKSEGYWQEIERGIFRYSDYPNTPYEDLIRISLWSRNRADIPQAVVSHDSALSVHELGDVMPGKTHLTVPVGFRKKARGGCLLHTGVLLPEEIEKREGFMVTTPLRTIQDCAESSLSLDYLEQSIRDAIRRGLVTLQEIQRLRFSKKAKDRMRPVLEDIKKHPAF